MTNDYSTGCGSILHFDKIPDLAEPISCISPLDGGCSSAG